RGMMFERLRFSGAMAASGAFIGLAMASGSAQERLPDRPRPGLTVQQTKEAVNLAKGAMRELRKKTDGASVPGADVREYSVGVELPDTKEPAPATGESASKTKPGEEANTQEKDTPKEKAGGAGPLAIVTSYCYFDDVTVFSTIDLGTGRVIAVE